MIVRLASVKSVALSQYCMLKTEKEKGGRGGETGTGSKHQGGRDKRLLILDRGKRTKYRLIYLQVHR